MTHRTVGVDWSSSVVEGFDVDGFGVAFDCFFEFVLLDEGVSLLFEFFLLLEEIRFVCLVPESV